jgi:hypothetical protein
MDINEYREEFINELRADASINNTDTDDEFVRRSLELLENMGELQDPIQFYFGKQGRRNRMMQFHAYSYDEADGSFVLIISDFIDSISPNTLTNTRIDTLNKRMTAFVDESYRGNLRDFCDDADETLNIGDELKNLLSDDISRSRILRFKFYIITNSTLSGQVKSLKRDDLFGRPVESNVWTIERFYEIAEANRNEPIYINVADFGLSGIPCIKADMNDNLDYDAYLAIVPGRFLADIYLEHGSRLLQGNIRAFLSIRGKVNKGIRNTIIKEPTRFFTYNNGIATTAENIELKYSTKGLEIISIKDFQIINGGQTTASLASAIIKKDNTTLNNIYVPMKLTVIKSIGDENEQEERYNNMVEQISRCANCQNPVKDADFFSNSPFHILMEKMSIKYMAPPVGGKPNQTVWFYERSRGKWEQEQMKMTKSEREKFKAKFPKDQKITKEELAKYLNTYYCLPHIVASGSAKNMKNFAESIEKKYSTSKEKFNEFFFKQSICCAIIFKSVDRIVNKQPWYPKGGNKAQIVPYTISKIISSIPKDKTINFNLIWQKQYLYASFVHEVEIVSKMAHEFLADSHGIIVREYAKSAKTWEMFNSIPYSLTNEFYFDLIDKIIVKEEKQKARKEQKIENDITNEILVIKYGAEYWRRLLKEGLERKVLTPKEVDLVRIGTQLDGQNPKVPSPLQAKRILEIRDKLSSEGIIV